MEVISRMSAVLLLKLTQSSLLGCERQRINTKKGMGEEEKEFFWNNLLTVRNKNRTEINLYHSLLLC